MKPLYSGQSWEIQKCPLLIKLLHSRHLLEIKNVHYRKRYQKKLQNTYKRIGYTYTYTLKLVLFSI